jgi:hypothetical protein
MQGRGDDATRLLRLARLPHWVWVVEAHIRTARAAGLPAVVAEIVFDSTSSDRVPRMDAVSLPGITQTFPPDDGTRVSARVSTLTWRSHLEL